MRRRAADQQRVAVGDAGVGQGIVGVECQRLLVQIEGLPEGGLRQAQESETAARVAGKGFRILRATPGAGRGRCVDRRQRRDDAPRQRVLHFEDPGKGLVKSLRPQLLGIGDAQQAGRDAQSIALALDRAFEHGIDFPQAARFDRVLVQTAEASHR